MSEYNVATDNPPSFRYNRIKILISFQNSFIAYSAVPVKNKLKIDHYFLWLWQKLGGIPWILSGIENDHFPLQVAGVSSGINLTILHTCSSSNSVIFFTARCTAKRGIAIACRPPCIRASSRLQRTVGGSGPHRLEFLETNCTDN